MLAGPSKVSVKRNSKPHEHPALNPTPYQLRLLVLDYLCHNCYASTAQAFAQDGSIRHTDADGDDVMTPQRDDFPTLSAESLRVVELRKLIRTHILSGRVEEATAALREYFPGILSEDAAEAEPPSRPGKVDYIAMSSVKPHHILLNLQIQSFVEATRTRPLHHEFRSPMAASKAPETFLRSDLDVNNVDEAVDEHLTSLLKRAQQLYTVAHTLDSPDDRALYLQELGNISGLLAYKVPEMGALSKYLSMERREAVANQVDSAILFNTGSTAVSQVELYARYTTQLYDSLRSLLVKRSNDTPPQLPAAQPKDDRREETPASNGSANKDNDELVPLFNLHAFMNSK